MSPFSPTTHLNILTITHAFPITTNNSPLFRPLSFLQSSPEPFLYLRPPSPAPSKIKKAPLASPSSTYSHHSHRITRDPPDHTAPPPRIITLMQKARGAITTSARKRTSQGVSTPLLPVQGVYVYMQAFQFAGIATPPSPFFPSAARTHTLLASNIDNASAAVAAAVPRSFFVVAHCPGISVA